MSIKVLVIGKNGQLGREFIKRANKEKIEWLAGKKKGAQKQTTICP